MNPAMQGYRPAYPQAQTRSPAATRRPGQMPPGGPPPQQHPNLAHHQVQQQRNLQLEHQMAQRRAKKPTDRNMPEGIEDCTIGEGVQQYKELRDVERKLDYAMMRTRMDIQDSFARVVKRHKTMRIWISNTVENQSWQAKSLENAFDFSGGEEGSYRVKIEGRLIDDPDDTDLLDEEDEDNDEDVGKHATGNSEKQARKRLSHFFKSMSVEFDRSRITNSEPAQPIEWKKSPQGESFDCLEFERKSEENANVTIVLVRDENPEKFRLSQALSQTLDLEEADRAEVVMGIWDYAKAMGLLEDDDKRSVRCDDRLKAIFGSDTVYFPQIPERIMPHLHPLPPVRLQYTIHCDQAYNNAPTVYDVRVAVDDPLLAKIRAMTQNPEYSNGLRQIAQLDDSLAVLIQAIQHSKAKHTFYKSMAKDPANFVKRWMSSQKRDLEVILGEATRGGGEDGSGPEFARGGADGVWGSQVVKEAVRYLLAKPEVSR